MTAYEQSMAELVRRVEALEAYLKRCVDAVMKLDEEHLARANELKALNITKARFDVERWLPGMDERERQDRWHATFNAVLPVYIAGGADHDAHVHAAEVADRAHGPLEAKAPGDPNIFIGSSPLQVYVAHVEALVKSVQEACDYALPEEAMALLTKAVEPFEAKP